MSEPKTTAENAKPSPADAPESVWTFRGYRMRPGEFNTAMVHFYRFVVINPTEEIWGKALAIWSLSGNGDHKG